MAQIVSRHQKDAFLQCNGCGKSHVVGAINRVLTCLECGNQITIYATISAPSQLVKPQPDPLRGAKGRKGTHVSPNLELFATDPF